jgi:serine phosphatase RsbU (regulator of sigma subunit)
MHNLRDVLELFVHILNAAYFIWIFSLYYLAIRKCFWKKDRSRIQLFFLTLVINPYVFFIITAVLGLGMVWGTGIIIVLLTVLGSKLIAKWLKATNVELVTFVSLMHCIVVCLSVRDDLQLGDDKWQYAVAVNIAGDVILLTASILLYCFVISAVAELSDTKGRIDTTLFVVPPAVFIIFNYVFLTMVEIYKHNHPFEEGTFLVILFSDIIMLLFIWAFHIIIKNINATNETIAAKDLAAEMAVAEAKIEADLSTAKSIQTSVLPGIFPPFPERKDFELFASMNAAKEVGGDFYDFYMLKRDTLGFLIADVSDKGIPAAMFMMTGKAIIKGLAENMQSPAEVFTVANEKLCEGNDSEFFITAWMGYLDLQSGNMRVANAGHCAPVLIRDGKAKFVSQNKDMVLASMDGMIYTEHILQLQKGDILYLYTDGVTEAMDEEAKLYGKDRLLRLLSFGNNYPKPSDDNGVAGAVCDMVKADIDSFVKGAEQSDDITMLCVRYLGES